MVDIVSREVRSRMMSGIRAKDTKPEILLRKALHARGFRFRLHVASLPGKPDIVLPRHGAIVEVYGCFWHRHAGCSKATAPSTDTEKWLNKFEANVERDARNKQALLDMGWRLAIVWTCKITRQSVDSTAELVAEWLNGDRGELEIPES